MIAFDGAARLRERGQALLLLEIWKSAKRQQGQFDTLQAEGWIRTWGRHRACR
jgi:hypothetical protein